MLVICWASTADKEWGGERGLRGGDLGAKDQGGGGAQEV